MAAQEHLDEAASAAHVAHEQVEIYGHVPRVSLDLAPHGRELSVLDVVSTLSISAPPVA